MKIQTKHKQTLTGTAFAQSAPGKDAFMNRFDELADQPFPDNVPTKQSAQILRDELLFQRATQVYLWALPVLNMMSMKEGSEKVFGAGYNVLPTWKTRLDAKTVVPTPNSDVIYAMSYLDLGKDGALVVEVPPRMQGLFDDFWQRPLGGHAPGGTPFAGDVGFFGPDQGNGGKYLLLPPNYDGPVPIGHYVYRSRTNNVFLFWRSFYQDAADLGPAVKLVEQTKVYPYVTQAKAKTMVFPDASAKPSNMIVPQDASAFEVLQRFVDSEGTSAMPDADWRGMLATIGVVKGQPFKPDARTRAILDKAARTAWKMGKVVAYTGAATWEGGLRYPDRHWIDPNLDLRLDVEWMRTAGNYLDLDARIGMFAQAYSFSPAMVSRTPGKGAQYMVAYQDADGEFLRGGTLYHLHLPPNIPVGNFWSITISDSEQGSGLDNGQPFPSIGSRDNPIVNADGSVDLYYGPTAPAGKENNWQRTVPGKAWFAMFRLYGPTQAAIDKSWKPADFVKMK